MGADTGSKIRLLLHDFVRSYRFKISGYWYQYSLEDPPVITGAESYGTDH